MELGQYILASVTYLENIQVLDYLELAAPWNKSDGADFFFFE